MSTQLKKRHAIQQTDPTKSDVANPALTPDVRHTMIAEAAYYLAEARAVCGEPPNELQDWLDAEKALDESFAMHARHGDHHP